MPEFILTDLPTELIRLVLAKCSAASFIRVHRTCKTISAVCQSRSHFVRLNIPWLDVNENDFFEMHMGCMNSRSVHFEEIESTLAPFKPKVDKLCISAKLTWNVYSKLLDLALQHHFRVGSMDITEIIQCGGDELGQLFQALKPYDVYILNTKGIRRKPFPISTFNSIRDIELACGTDYLDIDLLALPSSGKKVLGSPNITDYGIYRFLKQWYASERVIDDVRIDGTFSPFAKEIIRDLPVNLLYDWNSHEHSIFHGYERSDLTWNDIPPGSSIYIMIKSDNIKKQCLLIITVNCQVLIKAIDDPVKYVLTHMMT